MSRTLGHKKRIGLVLAQVPGYSETFLRNKIKGLQNSGYEVILFVDQWSGKVESISCQVRISPFGRPSSIGRFMGGIASVFQIGFQNPRKSWFLFKRDRKSGRSSLRSLKNLLLNQYLLSEQLGWLHFGFGALTENREFVSEAIGAEMGVSFRGFDLYLTPIKRPDCYELLYTQKVIYHVLTLGMKKRLFQNGISNANIKVIPPAIDTSFFSRQSYDSVNNSSLRFLTVARLHWVKGLEYTLEALALLKQQGIAFHYTLIGEGDQYERLVFAVHQLDLTEEVTFSGKQSPEQVKHAYTHADIYLQYSIQEGFCNAVLEAQAMGLLCIVSDAEGLKENVVHEETGWIVPKRQPELLSSKIQKIIGMSPNYLNAIRQQAQKRVQVQFNLEQQQKQWITFFKSTTYEG